ncbi:glycosyltransferase family 2 protein [Salinisphaera sp. P385]|uniref:Glycosyltransferase family 2 protein n=1 Tax=Spectribacter acetivorans TaxID=3075603 RepID=A0ABU3B9A0_9GAMM|nr:glycosyltransferase family 2 protein [Salinisphaera sp. P385]MDT0619044.1 glycosyltransferase family 2 protein [Salinisphaera sp. P385]
MSKEKTPLVSIVVPSLNQGRFIEHTLRSIVEQSYNRWELIVIDGGSTDGTLDVIERYQHHIHYWVSEPDKGQADAIQKGLDVANGQIFNWINSDDCLAPGALEVIAGALGDNDLLAGTTVNFSATSRFRTISRNIDAWSLIADGLGSKCSWHQPALWVRTDKLRSIGGIDTTMDYRFDLDLYVRYLVRYPRVVYTSDVLAYFRIHPDSKTSTSQTSFRREHYQVIEKLRNNSLSSVGTLQVERLLRSMRWKDRLVDIMLGAKGRRLRAVRLILSEALSEPWRITNRYTRRYLRRLLFRRNLKH